MRTISSGLMYQAGASRVNNIVSSVPERLSSSCRDWWVSGFPAGGCLTSPLNNCQLKQRRAPVWRKMDEAGQGRWVAG
jgi:hypothetical protein